MQGLYDQALKDAEAAEEAEILALVSLTREDPQVTWDEEERVLLCTWHAYPESYPEGQDVTVRWGPVWTFTYNETGRLSGRAGGGRKPGAAPAAADRSAAGYGL